MIPQALLVVDEQRDLDSLEELVRRHGFAATSVHDPEEARQAIEKAAPHLAVLDLDVTEGRGAELLRRLHSGFDTEVVVVTGTGSIDSAVGAIQSGVQDYLTKPLDIQRFERVLARVKRTLDLHAEVNELRDNLRRLGRFGRLVGSSSAMQSVYDLVTRVARTSSTVLLTGETGSGKDLIAETVHALSRRSRKTFVAVNCGAIQPTLIESELFGHEPGSFTGASKTRKGLFEQAGGGSLFLDEITEMPADLQVKLLRVLETRTFRRVGGEQPIDVDVRLIAATNRDPEVAVREGKLREDLFYRLQVFPIEVPPLRERGGDIVLLASHFLDELNAESGEEKQFDPAALDVLCGHTWPGNVRELRNVVERAFILSGDRIREEHVHVERGAPSIRPSQGRLAIEIGSTIAEMERRLIVATLEHMEGNKKRAAESLGISLKTLYNRLNSYGMGSRTAAGSGRNGETSDRAAGS